MIKAPTRCGVPSLPILTATSPEKACATESVHGTKAADRNVDEPLVARAQRVVTEAEPCRNTRPEPLDDDVGAQCQSDRHLAPDGGFEIECKAPLAAVKLHRHRRL